MTKMLGLLLILLVFSPPNCLHAAPDSTDGFVPPPEEETPVTELVELDAPPALGIAVGAVGIASGMAISGAGIYRAAGSAGDGFAEPRVQSGIVLTGTGVLFSSLSALILEWFLSPPPDPRQPPRDESE